MRWLGLVALILAGGAEAADRGAAVKIDRLPVCEAGVGGIVLAPNAVLADGIVEATEAARAIFEALFGRAAPDYAVVFDNPTAEEIAELQAAGYPVVLPWVDSSKLVAQFEQKLREGIRTSIPGLSKKQEDQIVAEKLEELRANIGGPSAVAHEMGHLWYSDVFWSGVREGEASQVAKHYGSPGPDWLDEISGIVFESESSAETRRMRFRDLWAQGKGIVALPAFLAMAHPEFGKARALAERETPPGAPKQGTRVVTAVTPPGGALEASAFYAQARVFADFLLAQGKPGILGQIAEAIAKGETFDQWLAEYGVAQGLASDQAALEERWMTWATAAFGTPG